MSYLRSALEWAEGFVCKYLKYRVRDRIQEWIAARFGLPVAGSILAWAGWIIGLVVDFVIPVTTMSIFSATVVGIPVTLFLLVAFFTASCE